MRVRPGTTADLDVAVELGLRFIDSSIYRRITPATEAHVARLAGWLFEHGVIFLLEPAPGVRPVGLLGGAIIPNHINLALFAHEFAWWVNVDQRGHGWSLVEAFEGWAAQEGAEAVALVAPAGDDRLVLERLYRQKQYELQETTWLRFLREAA